MPAPWPSFGTFQFRKEEHAIWASDPGWNLAPTYNRQRALGSSQDVISTLAIGSAERSFEVYLTVSRFDALQALLNTTAIFTDWGRPVPDSRLAFLTEVTALDDVVSDIPGGIAQRKRHTKITLVSQ